jgi:hypothetical protein
MAATVQQIQESIAQNLVKYRSFAGSVYGFNIDGYTFTVDATAGPKRGVHVGALPTAEVTLRLSGPDLSELVSGVKSAEDLFRSGRLRIEGDIMKALSLKKLLALGTKPAPSNYFNSEDRETTAVRSNHTFDVAILEQYLCQHLPGFVGPLSVKQFTVCLFVCFASVRTDRSLPTLRVRLASQTRPFCSPRRPPSTCYASSRRARCAPLLCWFAR